MKVLGAGCLVLGARFRVLGAGCLVLGAWCVVLGAQTAPDRPAVGPDRPFQLAPRVEKTLPNGLRVIVTRQGTIPKVSMTLTILSGYSSDPADETGLAALALYDDNPNRINTILSDIDKVTAAEVRAAARKYLVPANRTIIDRVPEGGTK